jgi:hypothetical protein
MAQHTVKLTKIPDLEVGKKDMRFEIEGDENVRIGTLLVSKGGIEWRPYKNRNAIFRGRNSTRLYASTGEIEDYP